jgi:acyl carrier protein
MTEQEMKRAVLEVLATVAPEADSSVIDPDESFQDQLDIDSIDFLNFVMGLYQRTGVDVPERDYPKVASLNACVSYLMAKAA